jgi:NADPH:quinone reductase-like Zn-dependent oxidoreductase
MIEMQIVRFGGPDVFRPVVRPSPGMRPGCVRIRVAAAGINFAEVQMRVGLYPEAPRLPFTPGFEVAGRVTEVGPGVDGYQPGDRVLAVTVFGGYATEVVLPAWQVRRIPPGLDDTEAAAIPVAFATAAVALDEMARVRPGDRVLVVGAAGGVGTAAVQLAARAGASVTGLVGSEAKRGPALALGAREAFTYAEWTGRLAASGRSAPRFDVVLESRGGGFLRESLGLLAPAGRLVSFGFSSIVSGHRRSIVRAASTMLATPRLGVLGLVMRNQGVFGANLLKLLADDEGRAVVTRAFDGALRGFADGTLRAVVDRVFPLAEAGSAQAYLQSRGSVGKVVLDAGTAEAGLPGARR